MDDIEQRQRELQVKILAEKLKQKLKEQQDREDEKGTKIKDPLRNQKAIIRHFGMQNRLK